MSEALTPKGKLDLAAASDLQASFAAQPDGDVVLDLSEVAQMGALCMQVCIAAGKTLAAQGHSLQVINSPEHVTAHLMAMGMTPETLGGGAS